MNFYDYGYDQRQTSELEFKATLLVTEFAELYQKFTTCFYMSLSLQAAVDMEDIHTRVSELELGMCTVRAQLETLARRLAIFALTFSEWERKQRLLKELRREARLGNYGPLSGKQRLIRELDVEVNHLAVVANERANCAYEGYQKSLERGMETLQTKCHQLLGRLDTVAYGLQAPTAYAVQTGDDCRYERYAAVVAVLKPAKETLAYIEQRLNQLRLAIKADYERQVENMHRSAQLMLLQAIE